MVISSRGKGERSLSTVNVRDLSRGTERESGEFEDPSESEEFVARTRGWA